MILTSIWVFNKNLCKGKHLFYSDFVLESTRYFSFRLVSLHVSIWGKGHRKGTVIHLSSHLTKQHSPERDLSVSSRLSLGCSALDLPPSSARNQPLFLLQHAESVPEIPESLRMEKMAQATESNLCLIPTLSPSPEH